MADAFFSLTVDLPEAEAELLESRLYDLGATGLEIRDREAPPMPGVRGPAAGEAIVVGWFDAEDTAKEAKEAVGQHWPSARAELSRVETQDWSNNWKSLIKSVEVGPLWVGPPWEVGKAPSGKIRIVIEPKMAFGTGDHPTTSLCLKALTELMPGHEGAAVLDVGTGTGVLAIAAKKLGAARTVGVDNDEMSVVLAKENVEQNGVPEIEISGRTLEEVHGDFEIVLANILANTLVELAPLIAPKVKKRLVLAGVLVHQQEEVTAAYVRLGLKPVGDERINEWIRLDFKR